jgi:hypothetical protein
MLDRMYAHGVMVPMDDRTSTHVPFDRIGIGCPVDEAEVFAVDNVAEYLYAETDQEEWHINDDFPCLALPAPVCWFETRRPSRIVSCMPGQSGPSDGLPVSWGMFATMKPAETFLAQADPAQIVAHLDKEMQALAPDLARLQQQYPSGRDAQGRYIHESPNLSENDRLVLLSSVAVHHVRSLARRGESLQAALRQALGAVNAGRTAAWVLDCTVFLEHVKGEIWGPVFIAVVHLDAEGKALAVMYPDGATPRDEASIRREQPVGDVRFLDGVMKCITQRVDILGLSTATEAVKELGAGLAGLLAQAQTATEPVSPMAEA